jgi:type IV pilus assembly protein PilB
MDLLAILEQNGVIDRARSLSLRSLTSSAKGDPEEALIKAGIPAEAILKAKGDYFGVPTRAVEGPVPFEVLRYIPEESVRYYRFIPLAVHDGVLEIGVTDPDNLEARDALSFISGKVGMPYKIFIVTAADFDRVLTQYKGLSGEVSEALTELDTELIADDTKNAKDGKHSLSPEEEQITDTEAGALSEDAPITKIVATILRHAFEARASDIHVESLPDKTRVRFRVDGVLSTNTTLPSKVHSSVVARIKVLSNMRLDEKRKPQDGRFSARVGGVKVDFRVSTFPTYYGEKVVMRLLGSSARELRLDDLGLSPRDLGLIRTAIKKPYGLVLFSGPTGSGKSTSLYAILNEIDREKQNVLSLEDPVEYTIPGVSQSQMRPEIGYTFASGLRTTLRQDPNVIMVGEIRDSETANLAVQAALTGHLVLSTIHTNNAVGIVPRLLDMGVEPYLIPPVLILGTAQRLMRTLCPGGGKKMKVDASMAEMFKEEFKDLPEQYRGALPPLDEVYRAESTPECPTGTKGRLAVFECFDMDQELERAILARKSEEEMFSILRRRGMITMKEDAIIKSAKGIIPFEEVNSLGGEFDLSDMEDEKVPPAPGEEVEAPAPVETPPDREIEV